MGLENEGIRQVARAVLLDLDDNILLVRYVRREDSLDHPDSYWVPPGGALEGDESPQMALAREIEEETGLSPEIGPLIWERDVHFDFMGEMISQFERFYLVRVEKILPKVFNISPEPIIEHRWWTYKEIQSSTAQFFPENLADLLPPILEGSIPSLARKI